MEYIAKEHHTIIMNHTYEIDWLLAWIVCERYGVLGVRLCLLVANNVCLFHINW